MADCRSTVVSVIQGIVEAAGRPWDGVSDTDALVNDIGLDSLDLAVMVAQLEMDLGVDPFRDGRGAVRTLGELVAVYEDAVGAVAA